MSHRHVFPVRVAVRSPFLFASLETTTVGFDTETMCDEDGAPIIPASHFKGLLRQAMEALAQLAPAVVAGLDIGRLFGAGSDEGEVEKTFGNAFAPDPGRLNFSDLKASVFEVDKTPKSIADWRREAASARALTRIAIDDETGTVEDGMLQVVGLVAPLDALVMFSGEIVIHGAADEAKALGKALETALRLIPYFGALRTVGFGEHVAERSGVDDVTSQPILATTAPPPAARFVMDGAFDRPFIVDSERLGDNVFVGRAIVPGAVVKGALAAMLRAAGHDPAKGKLGEMLATLRISHGFPLADGTATDRALPLALKATGSKDAPVFDATRDGEETGLIANRCADFQNDWKHEVTHAARARAGRPEAELRAWPRGHTAIERSTGAAESEKLFIEAARSKRATFRFTFDFGDEAEITSPEAQQIMAALRAGLDGVGKTRARLSLGEPVVAPWTSASTSLARFTLMLETPAALLDLDSADAPQDAGHRPRDARAQLGAYFAECLPGARLVDSYSRVRRVGGYPAQRRRHAGARDYRPFTLFEPGSCFVFEAEADAAIGDKLDALLRFGLPVMAWKKQNGGSVLEAIVDWRLQPWLPQAGYGEVSLAETILDQFVDGPGATS